MELTIEDIARMLRVENGDVEAVKQRLADIKDAIKAQREIDHIVNVIVLKHKLSPLQTMCAVSMALVEELNMVGKFFEYPKEKRKSLCKEVIEKTLESFYETEED